MPWVFKMFDSRETAVDFFKKGYEEAVAAGMDNEKMEWAATNCPHRTTALLQAIYAKTSPRLLVMISKIMMGWWTREVSVDYVQFKHIKMRFVIGPAEDESVSETYETEDLHDFNVFRHFGMLFMEGKGPVLDGYYPLRVKD
jgi:hypothetical protein